MSVDEEWVPPMTGSFGPLPRRQRRGRRVGKVAGAVVLAAAIGAGGFVLGRRTAPDKGADATSTAPAGTTTKVTTATDALLQRALDLHVAGKLDEATAAYEQVLAADANNKYARYNLGQIAQSKGDLDGAITQYGLTLKVDPQYFPALYNAGLAYAAKGDRTTAIDFLRKAVAVQPKHAGALFNLGTLLSANGSADEGTKLIADAIAIDPSLTPKS